MKSTGVIELRLRRVPTEIVWDLAEALMAGLDAHKDATGPMVTANSETGEVELSFEFPAVGDPAVDVPRAMDILAEAAGRHRENCEGPAGPVAIPGVPLGWKPAVEKVELTLAGAAST